MGAKESIITELKLRQITSLEEISLWIFIPETPGWKYYQDILIPVFIEDLLEYDKLKMKATSPPQK
jgi:hypothetical protein